jgi:Fe2+ transport system protein FeoA
VFAVGSKVLVLDAANFYFGREARVVRVSLFGTVSVLTVAVGNVTFSLREGEAELLAF